MSSDTLTEMYHDALDAGKDVFIQYVQDSEIVEYVEINGEEYYNLTWEDEWENATDGWWLVAERAWRE